MKSDTCREKLKSKREVYRQSDGRQELRSCIRSGISQLASAVHSAVVLYSLAFVSPERAELHCSESSAADLFVLQAIYVAQKQQRTYHCALGKSRID